jgi:AcrR family transcriptional regulator
MAATTPTTEPRPLRADAQRNRARLLDAAQTAFAARGIDASLDEIARQAGVGIGTLYRHFPTRDDLVEALIHNRVGELVELSERLLDADDPFDALRTWLQAVVRHAASYRGLAASLVAANCGDDSRLTTACHAQEAAGAALFDRAQERGAVRADATVHDMLDLVSAIVWVTEQGPRHDSDRLLTLALDGLRPPS